MNVNDKRLYEIHELDRLVNDLERERRFSQSNDSYSRKCHLLFNSEDIKYCNANKPKVYDQTIDNEQYIPHLRPILHCRCMHLDTIDKACLHTENCLRKQNCIRRGTSTYYSLRSLQSNDYLRGIKDSCNYREADNILDWKTDECENCGHMKNQLEEPVHSKTVSSFCAYNKQKHSANCDQNQSYYKFPTATGQATNVSTIFDIPIQNIYLSENSKIEDSRNPNSTTKGRDTNKTNECSVPNLTDKYSVQDLNKQTAISFFGTNLRNQFVENVPKQKHNKYSSTSSIPFAGVLCKTDPQLSNIPLFPVEENIFVPSNVDQNISNTFLESACIDDISEKPFKSNIPNIKDSLQNSTEHSPTYNHTYYPPGYGMRKTEKSWDSQHNEGKLKKASEEYYYEGGWRTKSERDSKTTLVPLCLPLCCAMPCVLM